MSSWRMSTRTSWAGQQAGSRTGSWGLPSRPGSTTPNTTSCCSLDWPQLWAPCATAASDQPSAAGGKLQLSGRNTSRRSAWQWSFVSSAMGMLCCWNGNALPIGSGAVRQSSSRLQAASRTAASALQWRSGSTRLGRHQPSAGLPALCRTERLWLPSTAGRPTMSCAF